MLLRILKYLISLVSIISQWLRLSRQARRCGRQLRIRQNQLKKIRKNDILLFTTLRNEGPRIPYFLKYYRSLGVGHFIFVDNNSTDNFAHLVQNEPDVSVFHTAGSYKASNFGMHWLNHILDRYGHSHWCVVCDPDEFLVYPKMDRFTIDDLTQYLENTHRQSFFTITIDMYGKQDVSRTIAKPGENPLKAAPYFDKVGYFFEENRHHRNLWVRGGVRMRRLFQHTPQAAPALNKTPLVRWKRGYRYVSSMHTLIPRRLNTGFKTGLTGALLHFKYLSTFSEKVMEELERKEHYADSAEYKAYAKELDQAFYDDRISIPLESSKYLCDMGLMKDDEWH